MEFHTHACGDIPFHTCTHISVQESGLDVREDKTRYDRIQLIVGVEKNFQVHRPSQSSTSMMRTHCLHQPQANSIPITRFLITHSHHATPLCPIMQMVVGTVWSEPQNERARHQRFVSPINRTPQRNHTHHVLVSDFCTQFPYRIKINHKFRSF